VLKWFGNRDEFLKFHQNADEAQRNEQLSKSLKLWKVNELTKKPGNDQR
jgi:hypothetical protein